MEDINDGKRKKDRNDDEDDKRREKKSKRARSRSRSPAESRGRDSRRKRKHSKSRSPDAPVKKEKENVASKEAEVKREAPARKAKETDMLNTRTGGAYIPPARLRIMQAQITDKSSVAYQRLAWEAVKKSIHGHINKINVGNIGIIIKELLKENIVRGRGLLCRSVIQAQAASPTFTNVYAALVAAVNSRFPNIGELLLKRLVIQFKRGFKRNDKPICISSASFIAHLVNQRVAHEILALELLTLLVETPTDDSVEVAIAFLKECGQKLTEVSSKGVNAIFEMLRNILHEGQVDKRVQYMIEVMFQVWKDGFKDHPALLEELELVPEEEQFTHLLMLDDATDPQDILNVFKFDDKYEENEQKYKTLSKEILGSDAESDDEDGSGESGSEEEEEEGEENSEQKGMTIIDNTETNLVALRRTIYLTINSSLDFEECAHKLMKMQLKPGQEVELCHMFLDCCAEQRTYEKFYGLLAQRFCNINRIYIGPFEEIFKDSYGTAHRLDTNRLRNVSKFFAHLLFTDSISWEVLECVKLNEEDTTSSSRIYIKILFQELAEYMGLKKLNDRLKDPTLHEAFLGVFPRDNPKNTRFSINFFTSIGLGGLTDELREHLKQMPKNPPPPAEITVGDSSDSSSSSSSDSSDSSTSSESEEEEDSKKKKKEKKKSKKTDKNKTPKTPENEEPAKAKDTERWGHDGFYDTYGKDARRHEPRNERDKDNFAIPRDVPRRPEQRNGDDRRRNQDDRNRGNDRHNRGRNEPRNERDKDNFAIPRDMSRRPDHRNGDDNRRNQDDRNRVDDRNDRDSRKENGRDEAESKRRTERNDRNDRDNRRERYESERDSGYESRNRREIEDDKYERNRRDDRSDRDRNVRRREKDDVNGQNSDEESSSRRIDDDRRDRDRSSKDERKDRESNERRREKDNDSGRDTDGEHRSRRNDDDRRDKERNRDRKEIVRDEDDRRDKERNRDRKEIVRDEDDRRDKERNRDRKEIVRDEDDRRDKERNRDRKEIVEKKDDRRRERDEQSDRSKSRKDMKREDSDDDTKKRKKDRKRSKESSSSESSSSESDSSDDDSKSRKRDKKRDDGWDIRGNSIRREVVPRFWDSYKDKRCETVERSPERSERSKDKRRDR